jgi:hypothetical protein
MFETDTGRNRKMTRAVPDAGRLPDESIRTARSDRNRKTLLSLLPPPSPMSSNNTSANNGGNDGNSGRRDKGKGRAMPQEYNRRAEIEKRKAEVTASIAAYQLQLAQLLDEEADADNDNDDEQEGGYDAGNDGGDEGDEDVDERAESSSAGRKRPVPDSERSPEPERKRQRRPVKPIPDDKNPWKATRE